MEMERVSFFTAIKNIIDIFNANVGSTQVTIEDHDDNTYNEAPEWNAVNIDFTDKPTCYDALMRVISRMNTTVANNGANDFYELYFVEHASDATKLLIRVFISGDTASPITVQQATATKLYDITGEIGAKTGTVLIGEGADGFGAIPIEYTKFWSRLEQFDLHPQHNASYTYPSGAYVQKNGVHYQANTETSNTPPHADWDIIKEADVIGLVRPSPYTYKKVAYWENAGSNPTGIAGGSGTGFDQEGMWDGNMVVRDEDHYRNWVHLKSTTDNFDVTYKYGAASGGVYRGLRCLVNGTGINGFAGSDIHGNSFSNAIVQHDGTQWIVIRTASTNDVCCVRKDGKNYRYNGSSWVDDSATVRGNDTFHVYDSIAQTDGIVNVSKQQGDGTWIDLDGDSTPDTSETYGTDSAVTVTYSWSPLATVTSSVLTGVDYYKIGAWLNWEFAPVPCNTNNSISESIGEDYGGDSTTKEPATFDMAGTFGLLPNGEQGWNKDQSEEQGPRSGIAMALKFRWEFNGTNELIPFQSNFKFRIIVYDTSDNVFFRDITILDNDNWEIFDMDESTFEPYRARAPLRWGNIASNLIVPELEVLEKFEWKNAKLMSIQWQESYDDAGRFSPEGRRPVTAPITSIIGLITGVRAQLSVDLLHFPGQLIASTGKDTSLNIQPEFFQRTNTSNYEQLKQDMEAQKQIESKEYDAWKIGGEGILDRDFGDSIYIHDEDMINDSDNGANTKQVVVKEFALSINGTNGSSGGFKTETFAVKRKA